MIAMEHAGGDGRCGRVPVVNGNGRQRDALHLAIDVVFRHLNPVVDAQQMVEPHVKERHHTFQGVLENPAQHGAYYA